MAKDAKEEREDNKKSSDRSSRLSNRDIEKMKKMATKVGLKVRDDKKAVVITKVLNNFERKLIHEVISQMDDVATESFNDSEGVRRIRIYPISETDNAYMASSNVKSSKDESSEDLENTIDSYED